VNSTDGSSTDTGETHLRDKASGYRVMLSRMGRVVSRMYICEGKTW
jgi:hypothetical protein